MRLANRTTTRWIIAISLALCAITIPTGLFLDDNFHAVALSDQLPAAIEHRAPWDGFAFAKDPVSILRMIDEGVFPCWSDPNARLAFFRPLTSLTLWLDYADSTIPADPSLAHKTVVLVNPPTDEYGVCRPAEVIVHFDTPP